MEMNKKMFALSQKMKALYQKAQELSDNGNTAAAQSTLDEFNELKKQFDLEGELFAASKAFDGSSVTAAQIEGKSSGDEPDAEKTFAAAFRSGFPVDKAMMTEGVAADGGYLVPQDIVTRVNEYKSAEFDFSDYIDIEPVKTNKGSRVYATKADDWAFQEVDEGEEFPLEAIPQYEPVTYEIKDYGGVIALSKNLLNDSDQNITREVVKWFAKGKRGTINQKVLAHAMADEVTEITSIDDIQTILISILGGAYRNTSFVFVNDDGLAWLIKQKDDNGRSLVTPDPTQPKRMQITIGASTVPVINVPNKVMKTTTKTSTKTVGEDEVTTSTTTIPIIIGDLRAGIKCFDRQQMTISASDQATVGSGQNQLNSFTQRLMLFLAAMRMDFKTIDSDAFVYAGIVTTTTSTEGG